MVVIAWLAVYLISQLPAPGVPAFFPAIIWCIAIIVILFVALRSFGYSGSGALH